MRKIRFLVADDHSVVRDGVRSVLRSSPDYRVVAEAEDGEQAVELSRVHKPDVVIMDVSMPKLNGIEATAIIKKENPDIKIVILTVHEDESLLREALQAGAAGYIVKRAAETELVNAVRAACRGDLYVHPSMTRALFRELPTPHQSKPMPEALTPREIDVLRFLARGYTNRQIGEALCLSMRTVEGHRKNLMSKLNLHSRVELTSYAEEHGLLEQ